VKRITFTAAPTLLPPLSISSMPVPIDAANVITISRIERLGASPPKTLNTVGFSF
jgi:hypothetical protein